MSTTFLKTARHALVLWPLSCHDRGPPSVSLVLMARSYLWYVSPVVTASGLGVGSPHLVVFPLWVDAAAPRPHFFYNAEGEAEPEVRMIMRPRVPWPGFRLFWSASHCGLLILLPYVHLLRVSCCSFGVPGSLGNTVCLAVCRTLWELASDMSYSFHNLPP